MIAPSSLLSFPKSIPSLSGIVLSEAGELAALICASVQQLIKLAEEHQLKRDPDAGPETGNEQQKKSDDDAGGGSGGCGARDIVEGKEEDKANSGGALTETEANVDADANVEATEAEVLEARARVPQLQIVAACAQLAALVRVPEQSVMEAATGYHLSAALRLVVEANVVEVIRERGSATHDGVKALHVQEIARVCNLDSRKLARILRLLATHHIFLETAPDTFANNRLSSVLDSGAPLSEIMALPSDSLLSKSDKAEVQPRESDDEALRILRWQNKYGASTRGAGLAALIAVTTDESMYHATALADTLMSPPPPGLHADDPRSAPFSNARLGPLVSQIGKKIDADAENKVEDTMFEWLSSPTRKHRLVRFGCAMQGMGALTPGHAILRGFNWGALPAGARVVDVGGGVGASALQIVRAYPKLRVTVQDMKEVVEEAPKVWENWCPEALRDGRVSFQTQNFFDPQPTSPNGEPAPAVFLLRMIMHNWPDAECEKILRQVRDAAREGEEPTKLVIVDSILMHACHEKSEEENVVVDGNGAAAADEAFAPEPLLANWGTANGLAYKLDLQMLNNHNAGERTLEEFKVLLKQAGWRIVDVHAAAESWMPQIVAVPDTEPAESKKEEKKDADLSVSMTNSTPASVPLSALDTISDPEMISVTVETKIVSRKVRKPKIFGLKWRNKGLPESPQEPNGWSSSLPISEEEQQKKLRSLGSRRGLGKRSNPSSALPISLFVRETKASALESHTTGARRSVEQRVSRSQRDSEGKKPGEWIAVVTGKLPIRSPTSKKQSKSTRISLEEKMGVSVRSGPSHDRRSSFARGRARRSVDSHGHGRHLSIGVARKSPDPMQALSSKAHGGTHSRLSSRSPSPAELRASAPSPAPAPVRVSLPLDSDRARGKNNNGGFVQRLLTAEFDSGVGAGTATTTMDMTTSANNSTSMLAVATAALWSDAIEAEAETQASREREQRRGLCECGCGAPTIGAATTRRKEAGAPGVEAAGAVPEHASCPKRQRSFWRSLIPGVRS